jgi:hypothetical protein
VAAPQPAPARPAVARPVAPPADQPVRAGDDRRRLEQPTDDTDTRGGRPRNGR